MSNPEHVEIVKQGTPAIEAWELRYGHVGIPYGRSQGLDVKGADLRNVNLSGAKLNLANFGRTDLTRAVLAEAWGHLTCFEEANLTLTCLDQAHLGSVNFSGAVLAGAVARSANFDSANFTKADLTGANLSSSSFERADLCEATLQSANLSRAKMAAAKLRDANLSQADLRGANLAGADLTGANLSQAHLDGADLRGAVLTHAKLVAATLNNALVLEANLVRADLSKAQLVDADLSKANLSEAILIGADLTRANLTEGNLQHADLAQAILREGNLERALIIRSNLCNANLEDVNLQFAQLINASFDGAILNGCLVYGISAWSLSLAEANQTNLVITLPDEPRITADNLEIAQFLHLLLNNQKIRAVIDTITSKVVLILGRFSPERKAVLDGLREALRACNYLPVMFDFDKPGSRNLTETIVTLAHMARFIIVDITDARAVPQELSFIIPNLPSVPVLPLLEGSSEAFVMFEHFRSYPWVLDVCRYEERSELLGCLNERIIVPAEAKAEALRQRRLS